MPARLAVAIILAGILTSCTKSDSPNATSDPPLQAPPTSELATRRGLEGVGSQFDSFESVLVMADIDEVSKALESESDVESIERQVTGFNIDYHPRIMALVQFRGHQWTHLVKIAPPAFDGKLATRLSKLLKTKAFDLGYEEFTAQMSFHLYDSGKSVKNENGRTAEFCDGLVRKQNAYVPILSFWAAGPDQVGRILKIGWIFGDQIPSEAIQRIDLIHPK
jgi:hypothetical protein